jgi:DNA-binding SARP family transcriptional activator
MGVRLTLLGPPRLELDGEPVHVDTRKAIALLAYLAITDRPTSRDTLSALLWPDSEARRARGALRRTLSTLSTALGRGVLSADRASIELHSSAVELDVRDFWRRLAERDLDGAVDLCTGDFMQGFAIRDSADFDDWLVVQAQALRRELASALEGLVRMLADRREVEAAAACASRWLALDPLQDAARGLPLAIIGVAKDNPNAKRLYERVGYEVFGAVTGRWMELDDKGEPFEYSEEEWELRKRLPN